MSIDWKEGVVCFGNSRQWQVECMDLFNAIGGIGIFGDFQLNEIQEGDYIKACELDTEQKYNDAVAVFGLFGYKDGLSYSENVNKYKYDALFITDIEIDSVTGEVSTKECCKRKITYTQLVAIGKLKLAMIEREISAGDHNVDSPDNTAEFDTIVSGELVDTVSAGRRNKSNQAYEILKSLDYEYDLVKQQWYKKQYV